MNGVRKRQASRCLRRAPGMAAGGGGVSGQPFRCRRRPLVLPGAATRQGGPGRARAGQRGPRPGCVSAAPLSGPRRSRCAAGPRPGLLAGFPARRRGAGADQPRCPAWPGAAQIRGPPTSAVLGYVRHPVDDAAGRAGAGQPAGAGTGFAHNLVKIAPLAS